MSMIRRTSIGLIAAVLIASAGCGASSPTSPASFSVSGTWTGKFEYTTGGVSVSEDVTMVLTQPSTSATGAWSSTSSATGTVGFPVASTVAGTFTINQPNIGSASCSGSSTLTGTASTTDLILNVVNVTQTGTCNWATGMRFTLKKQ